MRINLVLNFFLRIFLVISLVFTFLYFQNINSNASVNCDIYTESDLVNAFGDHLTSAQINACTTITLKNNITLTLIGLQLDKLQFHISLELLKEMALLFLA